MQDSESQESRPGFQKSFVTLFGRVFTRLLDDLRGVVPSSKNDVNFLLSVVLIGATVYYIPWVFTVIGVIAISNSLFAEKDLEERSGKTTEFRIVEEEDADPCADAVSV